jgi:hypothetical protein
MRTESEIAGVSHAHSKSGRAPSLAILPDPYAVHRRRGRLGGLNRAEPTELRRSA